MRLSGNVDAHDSSTSLSKEVAAGAYDSAYADTEAGAFDWSSETEAYIALAQEVEP